MKFPSAHAGYSVLSFPGGGGAIKELQKKILKEGGLKVLVGGGDEKCGVW